MTEEKQNRWIVLPMTPEDAPEAARLEQLCFSAPWSEEQLLESLASPLFYALVCREKSGRTAAYLGAQIIAGEAYITNVATHPDFRRKGAARALMKRLIGDMRASHGVFITLEVRPSNDAARALYRSLGFVSCGRRKNFYTHPDEDAELMTLAL